MRRGSCVRPCSKVSLAAWLFSVVIAPLVLIVPARAQLNADVTGQIVDQSGAAIVGATVTATNINTGIKKTTTTDEGGEYKLPPLEPGKYDIEASHQGFATTILHAQEVLLGTSPVFNFKLNVSSTTQTVQIQASEAPILDTTSTEVQGVVQTVELDSLPVITRDYSDLAALTPGATAAASRTGDTVQIGSTAVAQTGFFVDGISAEAGNNGGAYTNFAQDWIQEFSVVDLQFPAEYGLAAAGVINMALRSGTNQLHGRAYMFYQNASLNAEPDFWTFPTKAPFFSHREGGMVGGPFTKDKLFYFGGIEFYNTGTTTPLSTSVLNEVETPADVEPVGTPQPALVPWLVYGNQTTDESTTSEPLALIKLDYTPNSKDSFIARSNLDFAYVHGSFGGATTYGTSTSSFGPRYENMVGWTRAISSTKVNEFRAAFYAGGAANSWNNYCRAESNGGTNGAFAGNPLNSEPYNYVTTESLDGETQLGNPVGIFANVIVTGKAETGTACTNEQNVDDSFLVTDTILFSHGHHQIKVGGILRKYYEWSHNTHDTTDGNYSGSTTVFNPNTSLLPAGGVYSSATYKTLSALTPTADKGDFPYPLNLQNFVFHDYAFGGFAQDAWQARSNLTLNIGIRYDFANLPSELSNESWPALQAAVPGSHGFTRPGWHSIANDAFNISPRTGFAWTPFHNDKTVIRGGAGIFFDQDNTGDAGIYITGNSWAQVGWSYSANVATTNPYCIGNNNCANGIPVVDEFAVAEVLASALANITLPEFPVSTSPCAQTNSCTVQVGPNTYTIPALTIPVNPQGNLIDLAANFKNPFNVQYSLGVQQQFTKSLNVAADFVQILGEVEPVAVNDNVALTGLGATQTYTEINPYYTTGYQEQSIGTLRARYLQMKVHYLDQRHDQINVAYQYGHSWDDGENNFAISALSNLSTNPFNPETDYGPSSTDLHQNMNISGILPVYYGVQVSPIIVLQSALPYTATSTLQSPGTANAPPACQAYFTRCYPLGYSRNSLRGRPTYTFAARLSKNVRLGENRSFTVFAEGYNLFNHPNLGTNFYSNVDVTTGASAFGNSDQVAGTMRQMQLGGRFDF
jgi:Carboxypeptidase regulatory-like domain